MESTFNKQAQAYIESLLLDYMDEFLHDPSDDPCVNDFRQGILFAYRYAINSLKRLECDKVVKPQ